MRIQNVAQKRNPSVLVPIENSDSNLVPSNIKTNVNIFGVSGSLVPPQYASGSGVTDTSGMLTVSGLTFTPRVILCHYDPSDWQSQYATVYSSDVSTAQIRANNSYAQVNQSSGYVNSTGFKLYIGVNSSSINWKAYA